MNAGPSWHFECASQCRRLRAVDSVQRVARSSNGPIDGNRTLRADPGLPRPRLDAQDTSYRAPTGDPATPYGAAVPLKPRFPHPFIYLSKKRLELIKGHRVHESRTPSRPVIVVTPSQTIGPFFSKSAAPRGRRRSRLLLDRFSTTADGRFEAPRSRCGKPTSGASTIILWISHPSLWTPTSKVMDECSSSTISRNPIAREQKMARIFEEFLRNFYRFEQDRYRVSRDRSDWDLR